jgi:hypothetical protein
MTYSSKCGTHDNTGHSTTLPCLARFNTLQNPYFSWLFALNITHLADYCKASLYNMSFDNVLTINWNLFYNLCTYLLNLFLMIVLHYIVLY